MSDHVTSRLHFFQIIPTPHEGTTHDCVGELLLNPSAFTVHVLSARYLLVTSLNTNLFGCFISRLQPENNSVWCECLRTARLKILTLFHCLFSAQVRHDLSLFPSPAACEGWSSLLFMFNIGSETFNWSLIFVGFPFSWRLFCRTSISTLHICDIGTELLPENDFSQVRTGFTIMTFLFSVMLTSTKGKTVTYFFVWMWILIFFPPHLLP